MKNKKEDSREALYDYVKQHFWSVRNFSSQTLSTSCRQLALGEGGLYWIVKTSTQNCSIIPYANLALILLVLFFIFDASQYLISNIKYRNLAEKYDDQILNYKIKKYEKLIEPKEINTVSSICFVLKIFILLLASILFVLLIILI